MTDTALTPAPGLASGEPDAGTFPLHPAPASGGAATGQEVPSLRAKFGLGNKRRLVPLPPRDTKLYKTVMAIVALKAQGMTAKSIGEQLELSPHTIKVYLARAARKGMLNMDSFDLPDDKIDVILRSKVVRNVDVLLDKHDKDTTLKVFELLNPVQKEVAPIQQTAMVLQVRVDLPPTAPTSSPIYIREGTIGGTIATGIPVDAELVNE